MLAQVLALLAARLRVGGRLLLHFVVPGPGGWRIVEQRRTDQSIASRAKPHYGLNCFGRSPQEMEAQVCAAGFDVTLQNLAGQLGLPGDDDVSSQLLLVRRAAGDEPAGQA